MRMLMILSVLCSGCLVYKTENIVSPNPEPFVNPDKVDPIPIVEPPEVAFSVGTPTSVLQVLNEVMGPSGRLTLAPDSPVVISKNNATITIGETPIQYSLSTSGGTLKFENQPRVTAKVGPIPISGKIKQIELRPDDTGVAEVSTPIGTKRVQFSLSMSPEQTAGTVLPKQRVYMYSEDWCRACQQAKEALQGDLPFELVITNQHPSWVRDLPTFHWQSPQGPKMVRGWPGKSSLIESWRLTQAGQAVSSSAEWTFPGSTKEDLIQHLLEDGIHRGRHGNELYSMSFEELKRLHSQEHNEAN